MRRALFGLVLLVPSYAHAKLALDGEPKSAFLATGPGGLKIEGKAKTMTLADDGETLVFSIDVAGVDTGIALRNKHMREKYVKAAENPTATLSLKRADLKLESGAHEAKGTFTLAGVAKEVPVKYRLAKSGSIYVVEGSFPFDVKEHGIEIPSYLGVTVDPKMEAKASFKAVEKE